MPTDTTGVNALILERPEFSTGIRLVEVFDSEGKGMPLFPKTRFTLVAKDGTTVNTGGQKCLEIPSRPSVRTETIHLCRTFRANR